MTDNWQPLPLPDLTNLPTVLLDERFRQQRHQCGQDVQPSPPVCTHQPVLGFDEGGLPAGFDPPDCTAYARYLVDGDSERNCTHACQAHIAELLGLLCWVPVLHVWTVPER